jgi:hypothetical protein
VLDRQVEADHPVAVQHQVGLVDVRTLDGEDPADRLEDLTLDEAADPVPDGG